MVCLGNICRSPLAAGILKNQTEKLGLNWKVDSAGTSSWHIGDPPDSRSIAIARDNGVDISDQKARQFLVKDFDRFDLILTMDSCNYRDVLSLARDDNDSDKVHLIMNFLTPGKNGEVPDPYYDNGFPGVFKMLNQTCEKIIEEYVII